MPSCLCLYVEVVHEGSPFKAGSKHTPRGLSSLQIQSALSCALHTLVCGCFVFFLMLN